MRRLGPLAALVLTAAAAAGSAGCGPADGPPRHPSVLSGSDLRSTLLDPADVGGSFAVDTTRLPFYASCLDGLWDLPDVGIPASQASRVLSPVPDHWPLVREGVADYQTATRAQSVLDRFTTQLDGCDHVSFRNGHELSEADVRTDHDRVSPAVHRQLNVRVIGTTTYDGDPHHYDVGTWFSLMRVDNHLVVISYTDVATEEFGHTRELDLAILERLIAVASGRKPPSVVPLEIEPTRFEDGSTGA